MIQVHRSTVPVPEVYASQRAREAREEVLAEVAEVAAEGGGTTMKAAFSRVRQTAALGRMRGRSMFLGDFTNLLWESARPVLMDLFHGKCAYCESRLEEGQASIDLYRPREGARDTDGSVSTLHYAWLAFEWHNTLLACAYCRRAKGSRFPVSGTRALVGEMDEEVLALEGPLIMDPCRDNPLQELIPRGDGMLMPRGERGGITIEVLNLNRRELVEARRHAWQVTETEVRGLVVGKGGDVDALMKALDGLLHPGQTHLMARRAAALEVLSRDASGLLDHEGIQGFLGPGFPTLPIAVPRMLGSDPPEGHSVGTEAGAEAAAEPPTLPPSVPGLGPPLALSGDALGAQARNVPQAFREERIRQQGYTILSNSATAKAAYFTSAKRIERFTVRNFKAIEEISLPFPSPEANRESWLMLLGENGCGKSSILQALALTLMGEEHANRLGLDARSFVRRAPDVDGGEVTVEVSGVGTIRMEFRRGSERFFVDPPDPKVLLLGYGATRLLPKAVGRASSDERAIRILNLFDPTAPLADVESWLLNPGMVSDEQLERFGEDLARLLMLEDDTRIHRDNGHVELEYKGSRKVLRDMSDGFQSIIALAGDISIGVRDWWDGLGEAEGIVLLDEIEVHLHPTWKISIVERLRETCPMLSFVVTTHDPLCLKGLRPEEIIVLRRSPENEVEVVTDIPRIDHLRSDQLLSSFLFNLQSTRGSGTAVAIARYSTLLGKEGRNPGEEAELQRLRESLQHELSSAVTPMQRRIEEQILTAMSPASLQVEDSPERLEVLRQLSELLPASELEPA
jgi:energy-coupling factor transporter ATP-binding protein EcfA2